MSTNMTPFTTLTRSGFVAPTLGCAYGSSVQGTGLGFAVAMRERHVDAAKAIVPTVAGRPAWSPPIT